MIHINVREEEGLGLGKSKFLRSIQIKKISMKNAIKAVKFAAPIAAGFIPIGGGVASKLTSKVLNSKAGRLIKKVGKSKAALKAVKLSKTNAGKLIVNQAKVMARPQIEAIQAIGSATFAKTVMPTIQAEQPYPSSDQSEQSNESELEPTGNLMSVTQKTPTSVQYASADQPAPKNNNMLYIGGAAALAGVLYLATRKSK